MVEKRRIVQVEVESGVNDLIAHTSGSLNNYAEQHKEEAWVRINGQSGVFELKSCELTEINKVILNLECCKGLALQYPFGECTVKLDENEAVNLTSVSTSVDKIVIGSFDGCLITFPCKRRGVITPRLVDGLSNDNVTENFKRESHFMDVASVKILPSNSVLASLGLEGSLKIWPVPSLDGSVRVLQDKSRLSCFAIIGKGRNMATGSQDGSVIIWELGSSKKVWNGKRLKALNDSVLSICIGEIEKVVGTPKLNESLFDVENKVICVGHQSGAVSFWGAYNRLSLGEINAGRDSVTSIFYVNSANIVIGLANGVVQLWDYDFENKISYLKWETVVEVSEESNDIVEVKKVWVESEKIIVLTCNRFVKLNMEGELEEYLVGYDHKINDFSVCGDKITSVGKYGQIYIYNL